jgi:hypothetical protein
MGQTIIAIKLYMITSLFSKLGILSRKKLVQYNEHIYQGNIWSRKS